MLCKNEEHPDNDERFLAILSSVSFIMLKKGDYVKAKAFAEQVELYPSSCSRMGVLSIY